MARPFRVALTIAIGAGTVGCEHATGPVAASYLAIVTLIDAPVGIDPGAHYSYRVRELSGTLGIDTTVSVAPQDTVILRLPPATYGVTLAGLPPPCASRYGLQQYLVVVDGPSTSLARYYVSCQTPLTVYTFSEGTAPDPEMVYRLRAPDGAERIGIAGANDTLRFDALAAGEYEFSLSLIAPHCVVTSDGGTDPRVTIPPGGGAELDVHIACSDEALRPHLVDAAATYRQGVSALVFRVTDPDRDVERYVWDLTDCRGTSLLPGGARTRRGLSSGRTRFQDTVTVVAAFEVGLPDSALVGRCTGLRVADELGNTTPVVELPIRVPISTPPTATTFNAYTIGTAAVRTDLNASDVDDDYVGVFVTALLRDGVLAAPDGQPDVGIYGVAGYLGTAVPDLPLGSRIQYGDVYAVIVYLIDAKGNVTRMEDGDLFH